MTQKDKIIELKTALMQVKSIASSIKAEGDDYDMQWHKKHCTRLTELCETTLKKTK